ncbi:MAG: transketolase, partial [Pirellulaceae bacterium]|nr:transketolase [Pirellulaceae bacterium]
MSAANTVEQLAINTIRTLSIDAVQKANSGHPGTPMALAPVAYAIWNRHMSYDPAQPLWPARDRFVLSCGHASMLLYSVLHLAGVKAVDDDGNALDSPSISLDDIRNFRQLDSPCAGHPEYGEAAGIETTTGPLGQGVATSVGLAMAAKWMGDRYGEDIADFNTYALCSDGDLMEGIGSEAASLAGHLKLDNLCWVYDDNNITIEGRTELAFSEDVGQRFRGLGWNVVQVDDANDLSAIDAAIDSFKSATGQPTLVVLKSIIGYGSPNKADSHGAHGAPLGADEVELTKEAYGWPAEDFLVPPEVAPHFAENLGARGAAAYQAWNERWTTVRETQPAAAAELQSIWRRELPDGWDNDIPEFETDEKGLASRVTSGKLLNAIAPNVPWLLGGSADLSPSNMTDVDGATAFGPADWSGRKMHFGIREHAMAAACNGMALAGLRPYGGTFFVFTDYMRPSMRLSSIMHQPVIYILTHDSIGLGEDGPTHQPVEHLAACRSIPGLLVFRPGDANEVAEAYRAALQINDRPAAMVLTRQGLPTLDRTKFAPATGVAKGAYVLADAADGQPQVILITTGSELPICVDAYEQLTSSGVACRLVSMPCWELFDEQDQDYRDSVLPPAVTA